ncbi:ASKHA domain-containing protein [Desulfoscipio geothermicus]|uniref:Uncharacterized 2Fe-2 and 4Fe-4S clusters-containing protein, contains DUF4445 domain n=1 Tax=Desulfoscipio geothermicus DSM 3669 TaxID=1121426 RepID=A0A1I6EIP9_9FIRM|nr:ASKHA domain-containing protein [Desulfoscipio geothermicus]SFR17619.1 Uncharacterized 2Fe-2 and 4Fe-4S clusters-containing protein, contains DUF4445 domain [Desulfoscipio geothermicus DSM 3669]
MAIIIEFEPIGRRVEAEAGQTIMQLSQGLLDPETDGVIAPCGGKGVCGRCKVRLIEGELFPSNETEKRLLGEEYINQGYRLACQAVIAGPAKIEILPETLSKRQKLQLDGHVFGVVPEPAIKRHTISLKATTVDYPYSLWQQVELSLATKMEIAGLRMDTELIGCIDPLAGDGQVVITTRKGEIINAVRGTRYTGPVGFAVDLGTTKVAGYLVDLQTGEILAADGILNPQIAYGEDVISRLVFALDGEEQYNRIKQALREGLNRLLHNLCKSAAVNPENVEEVVVVGNTAMHHLILGLPVRQLARSPYVPAVTLPVEVKGRTWGVDMAPGGVVYLLPAVAGYVGGDHVAMILCSRIYEATGVTLGLDIGTNTEIVLARDGELISCSCASGPAFEGAHVQQGMRAIDGAICEVTYNGGQRLQYKTIGEKPPTGICGSGILDAVAELYRSGVVHGNGRLDNSHPCVRFNETRKVPEYVLVPSEESGTGKDIVVTQKDISEIQLAKAAIAAATKTLLAESGLKTEDIDRVIIAGAFGTHINLNSAVAIGMLPDLPLERYRQIGNAAGGGARMILLSETERFKAEKIARIIKYIELASNNNFSNLFLKQMGFPKLNA